MGISPVSRQILDPTIAFFPEYFFVSVAFGIYIPKRLPDFAVSQGDASEASQFTINDVTEGYPGYKQFQVKFLKRLLKCDVAEAFASYAGPFLSAYYAFVRYSLNLMFLSREIDQGIESLLAIERRRGFRRMRDHLFRSPRIISSIMASMLSVESEKLREGSFFMEQRRERRLLEDTPLYTFIERIRSEDSAAPASEIREIVRLFEGRHLRLTENVAVLVAGISGGSVGALLTWAISSHGMSTPRAG